MYRHVMIDVFNWRRKSYREQILVKKKKKKKKYKTLEKTQGRFINVSRDMTKPTMWLCAQRRLRSAWASAQSDQRLRCALIG